MANVKCHVSYPVIIVAATAIVIPETMNSDVMPTRYNAIAVFVCL